MSTDLSAILQEKIMTEFKKTFDRISKMELNEIYFWTSTIKNWKHLLKNDLYKEYIIEQLQWLISRHKVKVYGYVIMPNHLHFIWEMLTMNGKEMPHASFSKWTSHCFMKDIKQHHPGLLSCFEEETHDRRHRFWQRDPMAIHMDSRTKLEQKLDYIHNNPLDERWNLAKTPEEYRWSSAKFYMEGKDEFGILTHYRDEF